MRHHSIKINEEFAESVLSGSKCFEVRYNDRGYQAGDTVTFTVIGPSGCVIPHRLSRKTFKITYVLGGWGLNENYVAFGIKEDVK